MKVHQGPRRSRRSRRSLTQLDRYTLLQVALLISLSAHAILLSIRFVQPQAFHFKPPDSPLEVVLVNARSTSSPVAAKALAQADLNGGGQQDQGRPTSFLSKSSKPKDGEALKESTRMTAAQEDPTRLLSSSQPSAVATSDTNVDSPAEAPTGPIDFKDSISAVARAEAQIEKHLQDYSQLPRRGFIGPSTKGVSYAMYYNQWKEKIERVGTVNYPEEARGKIYGDLILAVTLNPDGSIYKNQVTVTRSSGYPLLDKAATRIVRLAAPYGQFSEEMRRDYDVFDITTRFSFTKGDGFEASVQK